MHWILKRFFWLIIKTLISTYRIKVEGIEYRDAAQLIHPKKSFIIALWHEQVVAVMTAHAWSEPYLALASRSKDGDYAAFVSEKMGFVSVRGSSNKKNKDKGGKEVLSEYIRNLKLGISGGLTIDGPKGPRRKSKPGVVIMAGQSGAPILPVIAKIEKYWEFNSWDKFKLPKPFSKIRVIYGPVITVPPNLSSEQIVEKQNELDLALEKLEVNNQD